MYTTVIKKRIPVSCSLGFGCEIIPNIINLQTFSSVFNPRGTISSTSLKCWLLSLSCSVLYEVKIYPKTTQLRLYIQLNNQISILYVPYYYPFYATLSTNHLLFFENYGQNWNMHKKRILHFIHLELLVESFWYPEQERLDCFLIFISICYFAYYIFYCVQIIHR